MNRKVPWFSFHYKLLIHHGFIVSTENINLSMKHKAIFHNKTKEKLELFTEVLLKIGKASNEFDNLTQLSLEIVAKKLDVMAVVWRAKSLGIIKPGETFNFHSSCKKWDWRTFILQCKHKVKQCFLYSQSKTKIQPLAS